MQVKVRTISSLSEMVMERLPEDVKMSVRKICRGWIMRAAGGGEVLEQRLEDKDEAEEFAFAHRRRLGLKAPWTDGATTAAGSCDRWKRGLKKKSGPLLGGKQRAAGAGRGMPLIAEGVCDRHQNNGEEKRFQRFFGSVLEIWFPGGARQASSPRVRQTRSFGTVDSAGAATTCRVG